MHRARLDHSGGLLDVALRPHTLRSALREDLDVEVRVERPLLAVDPAVAEGDIESFVVRHRRDRATALGNLHADARMVGVVGGEPRIELGGVGELGYVFLGRHDTSIVHIPLPQH